MVGSSEGITENEGTQNEGFDVECTVVCESSTMDVINTAMPMINIIMITVT